MIRRSTFLLKASRSYSTKAHTLFSPTPELLEEYLSSHSSSSTSASAYLLSTSIPSSSLQPLLTSLQRHLPSSVGSFSVSSPGTEPTLSIATFEKATTFRTDLTGRPAVEVGRYQRPGTKVREDDMKGSEMGESEDVRNKEGWAGFWKGEAGTTSVPELKGIRARSFLLLTDGLPRPVLQGLRSMYPGCNTIGMLSAPTPFLTGRPHTLIHGQDIHSSGTLGLALEEDQVTTVDFGLTPLTEEYTIAGAQGNLLLRIQEGSGNPTQTLMTAIQSRDAGNFSNKEEEFFLRIGDRMIRILSGDPSRGALSLDMEEPLTDGLKVQFMYRERKTSAILKPDLLAFSALRRTDDLEQAIPKGKPRIEEGFLGTSEDGFVHDEAVCTVPNGLTSWATRNA